MGTCDVIGKEKIHFEAGKLEIKEADAFLYANKLHSDFVVMGTITQIGKSISIDAKVLDVRKNTMREGLFKQCDNIDAVMPAVNDIASKIDYVINESMHNSSATPEVNNRDKPSAQQTDNAKQIDASAVNPDLTPSSGKPENIKTWTSNIISKRLKGLAVGDIDADGKNEIVIITEKELMLYKKNEDELILDKTIHGKMYDNYIAVDVADINHNGIDEIFITNTNGSNVESFVIEYKNGDYEKIATDLKWFFRAIGSTTKPLLLAQSKGIDSPFGDSIYRLSWKDGVYMNDKKMTLPVGISIYGLALDTIDASGSERCISLEEYDHLCIYKETDKSLSQIHILGGGDELLWKSSDIYGGTNNYITYDRNALSDFSKGNNNKVFIKNRILTVDLNKDGRKEILINKNISSTGNVFKNIKEFNGSEIYHLVWDGLGLQEDWKTGKIQGYMADYQFKDIDNDGRGEIVIILNISNSSSVITAYKVQG